MVHPHEPKKVYGDVSKSIIFVKQKVWKPKAFNQNPFFSWFFQTPRLEGVFLFYNMIELTKCNKLLDSGFSIITIGDNKIPNTKWKDQQSKALTKDEFKKRYDLSHTKGVGICTGYNFLEVIDVDLKVFSTAQEQKDFWQKLISYLEDSIIDFKDKFAITKTRNKGYHILFQSKRCQGNQKLASMKGHTEAVIETRGTGGYVFVYENFEHGRYYTDIDFITDEDRQILFDVCDSFDYKQPAKIETPAKEQKIYNDGLTPWDAFNKANNVYDIIADEFDIVRQDNSRIVVKRHGATSTHSGYIFRDEDKLFLHTTGSSYPAEKQIQAFDAYCIKFYHGDYSAAAKAAYADNYGDRLKVPAPKIIKDTALENEKKKIKDHSVKFPIEIYPEPYQRYILDCAETLDSSIDYMGCSLLWSLSVIVGNCAKIEVKKNWIETPIVWIACVGKSGIGKTPSINNITKPLEKENHGEIKKFFDKLEKYEAYEDMDKEERKYAEEIQKPVKTQFIANDITVEALIQMHQQSKNSVGVFKDELAGWFKDMNKYREGSDLEMWLSSWSGKSINLNRVNVTSNAFLPSPFMPVLGGIQPSILNNFYTDDNKDNGFIDRVLLSFPDLQVEQYNDKEMDYNVIEWYNNTMINLYRKIKNDTEYDENDEVKDALYYLTDDARAEWKRIFNKISLKQNSDEMNEYMKSMLPKQKSYIPRFALLIHMLRQDSDLEYNNDYVSKKSILLAEKLSDYFIHMAQKIKINAKENKSLRTIAKDDFKTTDKKVKEMYNLDANFNRSEAAEILGVSKRMVQKYLKMIKENDK